MMDTQRSHTQFTPQEKLHSRPFPQPPTTPLALSDHNKFYVLIFSLLLYLDLPLSSWSHALLSTCVFPGMVFSFPSLLSCCNLFALSYIFFFSSAFSICLSTFTALSWIDWVLSWFRLLWVYATRCVPQHTYGDSFHSWHITVVTLSNVVLNHLFL